MLAILDCGRGFGPEELVSILEKAGALSCSQLPGPGIVVLSATSNKVAPATETWGFFTKLQADSRSATPIPEQIARLAGV